MLWKFESVKPDIHRRCLKFEFHSLQVSKCICIVHRISGAGRQSKFTKCDGCKLCVRLRDTYSLRLESNFPINSLIKKLAQEN